MASRMLDRGEDDELTHPDLKPPVFTDPAEARAHRKARLAGACRSFAKLGYDHWVAGHITVRDPVRANHFWANPLGVSWHRIRVSDLLLVDFDANVVEGERPLNAAAFAIHAELHASRADVVRYSATGESLDKAGAYALQGAGRRFVAAVEGSESNVIGLPLEETLALLKEAGVT